MTSLDEMTAWLQEQIEAKLPACKARLAELQESPERIKGLFGDEIADRIRHVQEEIARRESELAILDEHSDVHSCPGALPGGVRPWDHPYPGCRTVRLLAAGYRHRDGYKQEEWAP